MPDWPYFAFWVSVLIVGVMLLFAVILELRTIRELLVVLLEVPK